jgi:hypothetical protein
VVVVVAMGVFTKWLLVLIGRVGGRQGWDCALTRAGERYKSSAEVGGRDVRRH